ncbi:Polyhydroxybutyrate depolymerase [Hyphomicrobiales bacterium]|nr:Polyhydroxybutyrate depolymerase [Hyphomicrobiales bacterium]CAH1699266.1 Polyhydroxybutyrate depolymerase [Hyphomicrobiales bacterium]CAI0343053.1 polyhydroxybutyrate depolymerase [Hyphomicrobiales bacterium]
MASRLRLASALAGFAMTATAVVAQEPALPKSDNACSAPSGCKVVSGSYRIVLPPQAAKERPVGAIVYFHGYQGSAEEVIGDPGLAAVARRIGVALIAPDGAGRSWSYPGSPAHHRDEFAFVGQVLDDVVARFPVDPGRVLASGFSQGGSMVWYLACRMPRRFAAFAPIAGAFWEPLPESCEGPRPPLIHVHGTSDTTVPLAGRTLRSGARQGDVFRSLAIFAPGGCTAGWAEIARATSAPEGLACRQATGCGGQARLELCLHGGGHIADAAWVERAWHLMMPALPPAPAAKLTSP